MPLTPLGKLVGKLETGLDGDAATAAAVAAATMAGCDAFPIAAALCWGVPGVPGRAPVEAAAAEAAVGRLAVPAGTPNAANDGAVRGTPLPVAAGSDVGGAWPGRPDPPPTPPAPAFPCGCCCKSCANVVACSGVNRDLSS